MARTQHFPVQAKIPVYSVGFVNDDLLVYSGGGGAGRSGVTNAIVAARVNIPGQTIDKLDELKLSRDEDAPMTMAVNVHKSQIVCGINNPADQVKSGSNRPIRIFDYTLAESGLDEKDASEKSINGGTARPDIKGKQKAPSDQELKLQFASAAASLDIRDPEQYVKVAVFSPNARMLAVASTDGQIALHRYPSLAPVWIDDANAVDASIPADAASLAEEQGTSLSFPSQDFVKDEIYDADFSHSNTHVVFTSSSKLVVYSTSPFAPSSRDGSVVDLDDTASLPAEGYAQTIQTIKNPALGGKGPCSFRAARFGRDTSKEKLFTVVNAAPAGGKGPKAKIRKSFITAWDADSWDLIETRHVSDRPVTVFDVSPDGKLLAYGSSDLSVGILDARTLRPVLKILHAHDFPPTSLRFNPDSTLLVSASADNTLRVIPIPTKAALDSAASATGALAFISETRLGFYTTIFVSLLIAALALWFQRNYLLQ
ncbi:WD40 repeat-like protein [Testicularia cyperi]|uniref:WD40 repeat-like protein n=1 Tax=Testicularia cyperi TaxID=1882483 RepID=A0A317XKS5_9BASI|nr:WD40 repeat-like protein [Testicularia cyperi]